MKRRHVFAIALSGTVAAALFVALSVLGSGNHAAAAPRPTPTPVALAYDEINRMAYGQSTPPPVGSFGGDYDRIMASIANPPQSETAGDYQSAMLAMQNGTLKRYTFYWVRGWIRVDDPATHTAVIYKCKERQTIYLDLAKRTFRSVSGSSSSDESAAGASSASNPYARQMAQPGTAKMTVSANATALGPKVVEGIPTQGYDSRNSLTMSNATGSCRNGSFNSRVVEYISDINEQRAYCPLPGRASGAAQYGGPAGGCKPTIVAHQVGSARPKPNKLAMYRMSSFGSGAGGGGAMVLERGHVKWLYNPDIPPLFAVPPGFKQEQ